MVSIFIFLNKKWKKAQLLRRPVDEEMTSLSPIGHQTSTTQ